MACIFTGVGLHVLAIVAGVQQDANGVVQQGETLSTAHTALRDA